MLVIDTVFNRTRRHPKADIVSSRERQTHRKKCSMWSKTVGRAKHTQTHIPKLPNQQLLKEKGKHSKRRDVTQNTLRFFLYQCWATAIQVTKWNLDRFTGMRSHVHVAYCSKMLVRKTQVCVERLSHMDTCRIVF